jgi:hypothetical protein
MSDGQRAENLSLRAWIDAMPRQPGPFHRFINALLGILRRRPTVAGYDDGEPPAEGAGVPARPRRPPPTLLDAAAVQLPRE